MKILGVLIMVSLLAACQGTAFERPPVAETACDSRLVGHWESVGEGNDNGDVQADIGSDCRLEVFERKQGVTVAGDSTKLHMGKSGMQDYLWVDGAWSLKRFESRMRAKPGDVFVMRYRVAGDEFVMQAPDDKLIAHRIIDGDISGETRKDDDGLQNRITGAANPRLLDISGFFRANDLRFRRKAKPSKP